MPRQIAKQIRWLAVLGHGIRHLEEHERALHISI
jgi:hypothetical protein